jgi:hypothetical protein
MGHPVVTVEKIDNNNIRITQKTIFIGSIVSADRGIALQVS